MGAPGTRHPPGARSDLEAIPLPSATGGKLSFSPESHKRLKGLLASLLPTISHLGPGHLDGLHQPAWDPLPPKPATGPAASLPLSPQHTHLFCHYH